MEELISRQAAIDELGFGAELLRRVLDETDVVGTERAKFEWGLVLIESCISDVKDLPSAQPERKRGKWIDAVLPNDSGGLQIQVCDQCNTFFPLAYTGGGHNFCPNCGADMREEEQDATD